MSDVCQELQNIKYQTMLLNHNSKIYETTPNTANIEFFLESEKESNKTKPWRKLSKAIKLKKLSKYAEEYCKENCLIAYENVRENTQWTLDRINNDIGHSKDNVVICCLKCNLKRGTLNDEKFKFTKQMKIIKTF